MSEKDKSEKPVPPVTGLFNELSVGSELTPEVILSKLMSSDADLPLKTDVGDPVALSVLDLLGAYAEGRGYQKTALLLKSFAKSFRENRVSFKRKGRREIVEGVIATVRRKKGEEEGIGERLAGKRSEK